MRSAFLKKALVVLSGLVIGLGGSAAYTNFELAAENLESSDKISVFVSTQDQAAFSEVMDQLSERSVLFMGETHNRFDHHLNQLSVIRELHSRGVKFAIGMEFFQRPFQQYLDAYVRREINEKMMLKATQYYSRWRFDFRLYRPILEYARDNNIDLVALNAPSELVNQVSQEGWQGVDEEAQTQLPAIRVAPNRSYTNRMRNVFQMHQQSTQREFKNFMQVQLLWDEYMAESAANHLVKNPQKKLVVLAGSGHVRGGSGIPERLQSRIPLTYSVVLSGQVGEFAQDQADVMLLVEPTELPRMGRFGLNIDENEGGVIIKRIDTELKPRDSSVSEEDRILSIAGEQIDTLEDVRLAMLDRLPGEQVWIELERNVESGVVRKVSTYVELI